MATPVRNNSGLVFGCSCPGCGAELEFHDSLWVTTCDHCDTLLRIVMPHGIAAWMARPTKPLTQIRFFIDRHFKEKGLNPPGNDLLLKQLYYPYWRVDGSLLKVRTRTETRIYANESDPDADVEETKTDRAVTLSPYSSAFSAGPTSSDIPDTLGIRAGYLRLFPFADQFRDSQFDTAPVIKSTTSIYSRVLKGLDGLDSLEMTPPGANTTQLLHPRFSLIYFPYIIAETYRSAARRIVVDGVTGKIVADSLRIDGGEPSAEEERIITDAQPVLVEPHRCTNCGGALESGRSLVYQCQSCGEWTMLGSCAGAIRSVEWRTGRENDTLLPFWAFQIPDFQRGAVARLLGLTHAAEWLIVPAFATPNLEAAYRLAKRATGSALLDSDVTSVDHQISFQPVTMELNDAAAMADMVLLRSAVEKQIPLLDFHADSTAARLVCLPFHPEAYFWVDSLIGAITVERAAAAG